MGDRAAKDALFEQFAAAGNDSLAGQDVAALWDALRSVVQRYDAVRLLTRHGRSARRLPEGMLEWRLAGMPVQSGAA